MKIDRSKLKKSSSEAPGDCGWLIEKLYNCSNEELLPILKSIETWSYGKCELHHWINVLDRFDSILEDATKKEENQWVLPCDLSKNAHMQELVVWVLYFTTLLVEHSFSRHLYSSVEHLITLLSSSSMTVILSVLNLLYMFSKRSNYITRLAAGPRQALLSRLIYLAESWGGKENGFGLAQCCQNLPLSSYPDGATTLHFEFYGEKNTDITSSPVSSKSCSSNTSPITIHINNIQSISNKSPAQIMDELLEVYKVPVEKQMVLFTHLRLAHSFGRYETRLQCVQARLQAISILVYCNALQDNAYTVLYSGLLDEFVDVLELKETNLTEIKAATLRTLTSIIHLERYPNFPKLSTIIDVTGASSYHGFLPVLVRSCISTLTSTASIEPNPFPAPLATSLFSFLYHLASYEAGGEALVSCGMMESLLSVVSWVGSEPDHITFVTRAVRVIDLITNLDMNAFQNHGGLNTFIKRLELEVNECRKEQPFVIQLPTPLGTEGSTSNSVTRGTSETAVEGNDSEMRGAEVETRDSSLSPMDVTESVEEQPQTQPNLEVHSVTNTSSNVCASDNEVPSTSKGTDCQPKSSPTCLPQRAALLKSMLNFLKKDIQDPGFSESMRHLMESSLPSSLKHIISNAEYYGPSLFLLATDVVTVYVFGEPSLLSSLQDNGLTDVVLHALLVKDVPATREVLASLPNVFSALCLNSRGLQAFVACKPFERLFKVLLSPDYLPAMRRRKSSDPMGDTASNLGNAMDELMRHQPSLKTQAMFAIVKLLEEVCLLGSDTHYVCWKASPKSEQSLLPTSRSTNDNSSDEEEEEEEERETGGSSAVGTLGNQDSTTEEAPSGDKRPVPLVDYVLNVMKFVDAILSNNSTDDHCKEFVSQKGLVPLLGILGLPNLPIDFPVSQACQSVASVCKSILNLAHESGVLEQGLQCLHEKLEALAPLHEPLPSPGGSVLLRELASAQNPVEATNSPQSTPLLHTLSAVHAYIMMLVHVCRTGQTDIRQVSIKQWGTELGLKVLSGLTKLYTSLVWESTVLLALCSDDALPAGCLFGKEDTTRLFTADTRNEDMGRETPMEMGEQEILTLDNISIPSTSEADKTCTISQQMKLIKPLLSSASKLGKGLAELFGLLVKLCVGSPLRQRRGQQVTTPLPPPSAAAIAVANALANVLHSGLSWLPPSTSPFPKFRLTFLICSVRFTNPMLFDDKKMPYHLMLQHFVKSQGLKAFFDIFNWAISLDENVKESDSKVDSKDQKSLPEGTGEFLDTWLFLLEKLVNPKTMIESPHSLPAKLGFCPLKFLIQIHKLAFESVMKLWNKKPLKNYGVKISESVLVILCSILKGEKEIAEKLEKEKSNTASTNTEASNITVHGLVPVPDPHPISYSTSLVRDARTIQCTLASEVEATSTTTVSTSTTTTTVSGTTSSSSDSVAVSTTPTLTTSEPTTSNVRSESNPNNSSSRGGTDTRPLLLSYSVPPATSGTSGGSSSNTSDLSYPYLQALLDMGFPQERCLEAISHTNSLEQATEFLLSNPLGSQSDGDMDFSEDDQWLQAVAMSLRESHQPSCIKPSSGETQSDSNIVDDEEPLSKEKLDEFTSTVLEGCLNQLDFQPQLVYKVCELLSTCVARNGTTWRGNMLKTLMSQINDQASELTWIANQENSSKTAEYLCYSETALKFAIRLHLVTLLFEEMKTGCAGELEEINLVDVLIGLLCSAQEVLSANPQILTSTKEDKKSNKDSKENIREKDDDSTRTPKWLAPAMLLLDLYEKLSVATKRRAAVKKVTNHVWKWFDVSQVKWYGYTQSNNKIIDDAYWAGESSVRIVNSRRKYTIQFHTMLQVNEETGNRRPVMISISEKYIEELKKINSVSVESEIKSSENTAISNNTKMDVVKESEQPLELTKSKDPENADKSSEKMECEEGSKDDKSKLPDPNSENKQEENSPAEEPPLIIKGFIDSHKERMVRACVGFMKLCIDPDTLHALMRLCLRITREWNYACLFANLGGVRTLLNLNESSSFWGFHSLAALLMRHVLEEPNTLRNTMRKVVGFSARSSSGMGARELHSLLRVLAPAACRDSTLFTEIAQQCLRIDLNMALKRNLMATSSEESILIKSIGGKSVPVQYGGNNTSTNQSYSQLTGSENSEPQLLIHDLMEALATSDEDEVGNSVQGSSTTANGMIMISASTPNEERNTSFSNIGPIGFVTRQLQLSRSSSANDMVVQDIEEQSPVDGDSSKIVGNDPKTTPEDSQKKKKSLLSKSTLCKLLAEFIRSYVGVAKLVTDHQYISGINEKITEDCSALAYLLDNLVCGSGDTEMVNHVRVLIAALASCNHAPDAQATLVTEVKGCLSRVMCLPESPEKHTKIQALVGLVLTMMESCPTQINQPVNNTCFKQQMGMNNMIRIMIKKNLVTDLARIPHCLDLSSPNMASTINAALKPLETVLRIVNMPSYVPVPSSKKKNAPPDDQQQNGTSISNSESTRAQGDENIDDTENTEHDISGTAESLEHNSEINPNEEGPLVEGDETRLEEILDRILDDRRNSGRDSNRGSSHRDTVTTAVAYVIDHGAPMDTDDTLHDSRMVTHSESQFLDDNEDERNEENDDESSGSSDDDDNDNDDNEEEVEVEDDDDDGDEDEDDEDDDDDEDEEGSVFDQGYDELEEAFIRLPVEREIEDDVLLMPSYQQYINTIDTIIFGDRISLTHNNTSHDDNFMTSTPNATNANASSAIPTHPLFQNPREVTAPITRLASRPSRQRGVLRYQSVTPRSHSTTTTILQRLLGPSHRDVLQLTSNIREATQLIIGNQDVRIIQQGEDIIEPQIELDTNLINTSRSSSSTAMPTVPNALTRWMEEARVLESNSLHDAVTQVKPDLMALLEIYRNAEQATKDKKKKEQETLSKSNSESKKPDDITDENEVNTTAATTTATTTTSTTTTTTTSSSLLTTSSSNTLASTSTGGNANGSTHNLIISILEQHFSSGSHTSSSSSAPTFTGLLTHLAPSTATGPSMSVQEPSTTTAIPETTSLRASSLTVADPVPMSAAVSTSSSIVPTDFGIAVQPVIISTSSLASSAAAPNVEILSSPITTSPHPRASDTDMSPSPPIPLAPPLVYQLPETDSLPQPSIDEAMSVSPPEFSNIPDLPAPPAEDLSRTQCDNVEESTNTVTGSSSEIQPDVSRSIPEALSPMDQQTPSLDVHENLDPVENTSEAPTQVQSSSVPNETEAISASSSGNNIQNEFSAILGDIEIPEGVDPSFLAALPEEMRQEVISEQLRIQRVRERTTTETTTERSTQEVSEVSAEFLAALPPNIQEEVLAQQRIEQQRQQAARANPDDPTSFLLSLPQSLRQTILSDLEDSQFSALPTEVVQEAQNLRRQREDRSRHVHEHMFSRGGSSSISHILRTTARMGPRFLNSSGFSSWHARPSTSNQQVAASSKVKGQQVLDHEAMTCLLVLLFVDEPKLNTTRLHRVLKSLCQHPPTRDWVIKTLLSIIERCGTQSNSYNNGKGLNESEAGMSGLSLEMSAKKNDKNNVGIPMTSTPNAAMHYSQSWKSESKSYQSPSWLSMSMDAALGCRANIFQIQKPSFGGKKNPAPTSGSTVHIHPQAAPLVVRHVIDLLISLAKIFPSHFLPSPKETDEKGERKSGGSPTNSAASGAVAKGSKTPCNMAAGASSSAVDQTDFWELLVKLDSISVSRKGKGLPRTLLSSSNSCDQDVKSTSLETSPLGQLIQQLAHPVIKRSSLLTDRLLRLLALVSLGHSDTADIPLKPSMSSPETSKALEHLLGLSIQVLTSKSCSEEGLEDATALLLHLSHGPPPARDLVLKLLLQGAATLGQTVTVHINSLLEELTAYNKSHPPVQHDEDISLTSEKAKKGVLKDRFTCDKVVITSSKVKPPCEVQLPSMSALTSKTSSQAFFLRTLKVIIQLREAIRLAKNRKNKSVVITTTRESGNNVPASASPEQESVETGQAQTQREEESTVEQLTPPQENEQSLHNTSEPPSQAPASQQMEISAANTGEESQETQPITAPTVTVNSIENEATTETPSEAMEVDLESNDISTDNLKSLSGELGLDELWSTLSKCLVELGETPDTHAVLVLQPAVEAFFLVHASAAVPDKKVKPSTPQESREAQLAHLQHEIAPLSPLPASQTSEENRKEKDAAATEADAIASDAEKFLKFAETHRSVLNQILRQSTVHLADGPFSVLVDHTRLLDFDIKRKYFRTELERADDGIRREDLAVHVRREHVFEDSFRELHRRSPDEWKNRFYIVFEGEEGQDAGGLLREWYVIISREIFNPMYALFCISPGDRVTYMINPSSHCNSNHLSYFKFVGRVIAKAIYDNKLLECYFTRSFYKHILGKMVRVADMESEDYSFYQGLIYLLEHIVADLGYELTFSTEVQEFGVTEARDLKPGGRNIPVTEENKLEYIRLVCQEKMTGAIKKQLNSFLEGFYDIIPKRLISIFNEQELELLISGLPTIDIDDLKNNTEYHKYHPNSLQIQWFWRALRSFDQAERAKLVQFVTGTSKVPLQGFSALEGMNGTQKFQIHRDDRSTDRLPSAHTCFNQLDLPVYETYDKLRHYLLKAIQECSEGFGFA